MHINIRNVNVHTYTLDLKFQITKTVYPVKTVNVQKCSVNQS